MILQLAGEVMPWLENLDSEQRRWWTQHYAKHGHFVCCCGRPDGRRPEDVTPQLEKEWMESIFIDKTGE